MDASISMGMRRLGLLYLLLILAGCSGADEATRGEDWLTGGVDERFALVQKQLRGFDMAMVETGYRFSELYFAGLDQNWPYARYQLEKIELAIRLGLERRPKRTASAQSFLQEDLPAVAEAVEAGDADVFLTRMQRLRSGCMRCHVREEVPHFTVEFPERRQAPIRLK